MFTSSKILLSDLIEGEDIRLVRDAEVSFVAKIPYDLPGRFVSCAGKVHVDEAEKYEGIAAVLTTEELSPLIPDNLGLAVCDAPYPTSFHLHEKLYAKPEFLWRSFPSRISPDARISPSAHIAENDVVIGAGTVVMPGAVVLERSVIGENSVIGPGTIVGCDAFQAFKTADTQRIIRQAGGVRIGDGVEFQANCTISKAIFGGFTTIGDATLVDSQVHVGHDCVVEERVLIANSVSLAGRVHLKRDVYVAPNATISNGIVVEEGAQITIGSTVLSNVDQGEKVTGFCAMPHKDWMMRQIHLNRLGRKAR